jgi:hypothetical protein
MSACVNAYVPDTSGGGPSSPANPFSSVTSAETAAGLTSQNLTLQYEPYDLRRYGAAGDGVTLDTAAINTWINVCQRVGYGLLYPGIYLTTGAHSVTQRFNMFAIGGGEDWTTSTPQFKLSQNAANLFNWNGLNNAGPTINGILIQGVIFHGGSFTCSDSLVAMQGVSLLTMRDCGFHNVVGQGLRVRQLWDSKIQTTMFRNVNASGATVPTVINIDSRFNSDNNQNVNNLTFDQIHMETNNGALMTAASDSNLFIWRVVNSKFEIGAAVTGPFPVFDMKNGLTAQFRTNTIHGFNSANGFSKIFKFGDTAASTAFADYDVSDNSISAIDASTAYIDTQGVSTTGKFEKNTQSGTNVLGLVNNASGRACRFEYPVNSAIQSDLNQSFHHSQNALNGFVGVDRLGDIGPQSFTIDSTSYSTTKSVISSSAASTILISFPMPPFQGFPGSIRLGVRCKSASGAGTVNLQVNTTTFTALNAPSTTFGLVWFDVTNDLLSIMGNSGSDRLRVSTGAGNAEATTVDGFYFVPCPWHYTKTFTYDPASMLTLTPTSTTTTVTGAALGDHVDVYAPYDLQGIQCTGYVSSANTVTVALFNSTAGTVDLASGSWVVRVTKK